MFELTRPWCIHSVQTIWSPVSCFVVVSIFTCNETTSKLWPTRFAEVCLVLLSVVIAWHSTYFLQNVTWIKCSTFSVWCTVYILMCCAGDTASSLGSAVDELMRHQPALRTEATKAIINVSTASFCLVPVYIMMSPVGAAEIRCCFCGSHSTEV